MTKKEFLNELRKNLSGLPKEDIDDRVSFYEEMINDRMSEGKTEEEAIADIGTTDDAIKEIASKTKFTTLVKEKMKPKRSLSAIEIVLIILGFPIWFPLLITALSLIFVAYILLWVLVIVTYSIEFAFAASFLKYGAAFVALAISGNINISMLGVSLLFLAAACFFVFACIPATKLSIRITKNTIISIKSKIIRHGGKENE